MLRISKKDYGTDDGRFQPGDPATNYPASRVSADWLNSVQEEISNVIRSRPNMKPDGSSEHQLIDAILDLSSYGLATKTCSLANAQVSPTNLPLDPFDGAKLAAVYFNALSLRNTIQASITFFTSHVAVFNSVTKSWALLTQFDPALLNIQAQPAPTPVNTPAATPSVSVAPGPHVLSITTQGKLQYQTSTLVGDQHQGTLTLSHFKYLRSF